MEFLIEFLGPFGLGVVVTLSGVYVVLLHVIIWALTKRPPPR